MLKYFFYLLLPILLIACGGSRNNSPYSPRTPRIPNPNINQPGQCFYGYMTNMNFKNYELLLAEAPYSVCGKSWREGLSGQFFAGPVACNHWAKVTPVIEISFDLQFTRIQQFQITPRNSRGITNAPVLFPANTVIEPQNEDKGWGARITPTGYKTGNIEFYCRDCDFNENDDMSIKVLYRNRPIGTLLVNPQSTITRCQSTTSSAYPPSYPHAY